MKQWMLYVCLMLSGLCIVGCARRTVEKGDEIRIGIDRPQGNVEVRDADGNVLLTKEYILDAKVWDGEKSGYTHSWIEVYYTMDGKILMEETRAKRQGTPTSLYVDNEKIATRIEGEGAWNPAHYFRVETETYEEALEIQKRIYGIE